MALNRSDKSRILRRYFPGMTRNSEMSTEPSTRRGIACIASDTGQVAGDGISEALRAGLGGRPFFFSATWPVASSACQSPWQ